MFRDNFITEFKLITFLILVSLSYLLCGCCHSKNVNVVGVWMRNVENSDYCLMGCETYNFSDTDTLRVDMKLLFNAADEGFKCSYKFGISYQTLYKLNHDTLKISYVHESFNFYSNDTSFCVSLVRAGDNHKLDSVKCVMEDDLTQFFENTLKASIDSIYSNDRTFIIRKADETKILLTSDGLNIVLDRFIPVR